VRRAVEQLGDTPSDDALHRVRVRAKQCRYAAEACEPAFRKPARRLARAMAQLQNGLGEHQDATVAIDWLTKTAHECSPAEAFAIGMLAQVEREAAAAARAAFPGIWRRVDDTRVHGWL
jgi:CHAD domain-containing protein